MHSELRAGDYVAVISLGYTAQDPRDWGEGGAPCLPAFTPRSAYEKRRCVAFSRYEAVAGQQYRPLTSCARCRQRLGAPRRRRRAAGGRKLNVWSRYIVVVRGVCTGKGTC